MIDFAAVRRNMVDTQLRTYDVNSKRVLDAMDAVGREHFVPAAMASLAYADQSVHILSGSTVSRSLIQPMVLARMIQAAEIEPGERVLSVAGGTGYGVAILAAMGAEATLLESDDAVAGKARTALTAAGVRSVDVVVGDLADGYARGAPFDAILIEGSISVEPNGLLAQLAERGRLVAVFGEGRAGRAVVYRKAAGSIGRRNAFDAAAVPLPQFQPPPTFRF